MQGAGWAFLRPDDETLSRTIRITLEPNGDGVRVGILGGGVKGAAKMEEKTLTYPFETVTITSIDRFCKEIAAVVYDTPIGRRCIRICRTDDALRSIHVGDTVKCSALGEQWSAEYMAGVKSDRSHVRKCPKRRWWRNKQGVVEEVSGVAGTQSRNMADTTLSRSGGRIAPKAGKTTNAATVRTFC